MASPNEVDRISGGGSTSATPNHAVLMPAVVNAGDLLLAFIATESGAGMADYSGGIPAGWSLVAQARNSSNNANAVLFAKVADGSEDGTTVTFVTDAPTGHRYASQSAVIEAWYGSIASGVAVASDTSGGAAGSNDPPNLAPSWGSADNLWYAFKARQDVNSSDSISYPSGYSDGLYSSPGGGTATKTSVATAWKQATAASEDPGVFTGTGGVCMTIAVRGSDSRPIKALAYDPIEGALYILRGE